ncbi:NADH dehydrogenase [ubiquinone] 1 alphasubcomplex assembly factor 3 [Striga asiatica]|uniref:NADH dehydrogenase [ubiquinone] 1 alphasubcomplex assembly factor 3 n=1 Tax=Striga asiatica TaxID=4170 RepID=A0A5A7RJS4_STRAF|nr:NADH dehydrogenase [ubiquinone] 1 alphasubcomplex assembly factor 3 [Striga asiatica]
MFSLFDDTGFKVNGVKHEGSLLCVGNLIMSWAPKKFADISDETCETLEILILGCGKYVQPVKPELHNFIRSTGMKFEAVDSRNAASTYNLLNEEGRIVAAALIPYGVES